MAKDDDAEVGQADLDKEPRYRAPALEKGLDILELLSKVGRPMTVAMITQELGRSTGELFRMLQVLEYRGFIEQADGGNGYVATSKLFALGMAQPPVKSLLETALPVMRRLADDTEQSCHLATRAGGYISVVARMESAGFIGFSVRLGYRQPLPLTGSGTVLYAFQPTEVRTRWEAQFEPQLGEQDLMRFRRRADKVARQGFDQHPSAVVPGIVDISAPIVRGDFAVAALTMPFVNKAALPVSMAEAIELVCNAAREISADLPASDLRV